MKFYNYFQTAAKRALIKILCPVVFEVVRQTAVNRNLPRENLPLNSQANFKSLFKKREKFNS